MPVILYDDQTFAHLRVYEPDAAACRRIARQLIRDGVVLLYHATETNSHALAIDWTGDAADHLHAAGKLLDGKPKFDLLQLSIRLREAIKGAFGHPNGCTLDAVADEAEMIADTLGGERAMIG